MYIIDTDKQQVIVCGMELEYCEARNNIYQDLLRCIFRLLEMGLNPAMVPVVGDTKYDPEIRLVKRILSVFSPINYMAFSFLMSNLDSALEAFEQVGPTFNDRPMTIKLDGNTVAAPTEDEVYQILKLHST